jgi:CSLREA domain-containing protein
MHSLISKTRLLAAAVTLATAALASDAAATTFVVDTIADSAVDTCDTPGACTLRRAILEAVALPGRDVITFDPAVFPPQGHVTVDVASPLPVVADPAGTVIDGTGAGAGIRSLMPDMIDVVEAPHGNGLVFASAPGVPLRDAALIDVTISGFGSSGVVVCGGAYPECDQDVVAPVVRRVSASWNTGAGVLIQGRNVTKARIDESVATGNDVGLLIDSSSSVTGARIVRSALKANVFAGIWLGPNTDTIFDLAITDTSASDGVAAIIVAAAGNAAKVSLANVAVTGAESFGILTSAITFSGLNVSNVVSSRNGNDGLLVSATTIDGLVLKDVVTNANDYGIRFLSDRMVGAKITQVTAARNTKDGVTLLESTGAKISRVAVAGNGGHGLVVQGDRNALKHVRAAENVGDGVRVAGPGSGNTVTGVSSTANQGAGIHVDGNAVANTIKKNVALGSDAIDLFDASPACATNVWKDNVFELRNDACIR